MKFDRRDRTFAGLPDPAFPRRETTSALGLRAIAVVALALACGWALPASADDDRVGFFEARRLASQAEDALAAGQGEDAAELYQRLVDGLDADSRRRADALYGRALAELTRPESARDVALLRASLDQLASSYPDHDRAVDARAMIALLDVEPPDPAPIAVVPAEPEPAEPEVVEVVDDERVAQLQSRVRSLQKQLAEAREELEQKEEALSKLKELVVEGGG